MNGIKNHWQLLSAAPFVALVAAMILPALQPGRSGACRIEPPPERTRHPTVVDPND